MSELTYGSAIGAGPMNQVVFQAFKGTRLEFCTVDVLVDHALNKDFPPSTDLIFCTEDVSGPEWTKLSLVADFWEIPAIRVRKADLEDFARIHFRLC